MMLPASTASPPNFFTPRRLDSESRPLREEPPAFLCAIGVLLKSLYLLSRFSLGCGLLGRCLLRLCGFSFSGCCRSLLCGCLLGWLCTAGKDFRNANRRQFLTMPAGALGVLAATLFERNYLACTTLFYDFSSHNSAFNQRSANG